jgi:hypothetical protein
MMKKKIFNFIQFDVFFFNKNDLDRSSVSTIYFNTFFFLAEKNIKS